MSTQCDQTTDRDNLNSSFDWVGIINKLNVKNTLYLATA